MTSGIPWAEAAQLRQGLYRYLAAALLPPSPERIELLAESAVLLDEMGIEEYAFAPAWRRLADLMAPPPLFSQLATEYVRLFESGVDGALCPPIESFYTTSARSGGTASVIADLSKEYGDIGLAAAGTGSVTVDHISTELEVMAALCAQEAAHAAADEASLAEATVAREQAFLEDHLTRWLPDFAERLAAAAAPPFYDAAISAAIAFTHHDLEWVTLVGPPEVLA